MTDPAQREAFLLQACAAAMAGEHIFPDFAVCEAALESSWGQSSLARQANNLFGQKQGKHALPYQTIDLETHEVYETGTVLEKATWLVFHDWPTCFRERMALLRRLPLVYGPALAAAIGADFVRLVSGYENSEWGRYVGRWSTDPDRAVKVLQIYRAHEELLAGLRTQ